MVLKGAIYGTYEAKLFQGGSYSKYIKEAVHGIWNNTSVENKILNSAALQRKLAYSVKS